eukprot:CAMPEP_0202063800 /NCGR_PEP_ID=MMETSP0963-20130614/47419_1 /ASSEMBLY_ACC=CAM_ASM_000494 /TAXON_ID=4773 /ORGANISM="Schizochytrium aggregatum, Strain ATCC28209" /LENGTH=81 /DNA_ID=CAMNT_0048630219 /DNA_START=464 /DNA_END=709 /DNA_ORIENTATION=-
MSCMACCERRFRELQLPSWLAENERCEGYVASRTSSSRGVNMAHKHRESQLTKRKSGSRVERGPHKKQANPASRGEQIDPR